MHLGLIVVRSIPKESDIRNGEFEVIIDSLKEAQGLFPLDVVGFKADMLNYYGKFPLEEICLEWKAEMNDRYGGAMCALF